MSIYKDDLNKIWLSYSAVHGYEECPYSFYLKRIEKIDGITNGYAESGSFDHEILEALFTKKLTKEEALDRILTEFEDSITDDTMSEDSIQKKMYAFYNYVEGLNLDEFFGEYEIIGVEYKFRWKIGKYKLVGFADLILKRKSDDIVILVDHKSAGHFMKVDGVTPLKNQRENLEAYKKQMYLYADAMKQTIGYLPDLIVWNHFLDGGKKTIIPFDNKEYKEALEWAKQTIDEIYDDEEFEARQSYIRCNVLCEYREMCEYKNE